ncbi:GNAT family N-acetyltransferase [Microvirga roseola]|uniref:GNAT family N-acetyltransferase n=1 Tax=Microvirga roseola TaxID=2883126 RepID=UPI001E4102F5|nr:GNAT family N-acetyltransferase [Microvirga roseola]
MRTTKEQYRTGVQYLEAATELLRRVRSIHPTAGLLEAADLHWWWRTPRSTDNLPQLFWFDHLGRPEAAVITAAWDNRITLDLIVMPDAAPDWVAHIVERGLTHASECGFEAIDVVVDRADCVMREVLTGCGFAIKEDSSDVSSVNLSVITAWLAADARPEISPLGGDYRLYCRLDTMPRPHHMLHRSGPDVETRLRQAALYRPDLDLLVLDDHERVAAYGLFWFDPETATGLVEPMRTEDDHQRQGLARHILTAGINLLVEAGAAHIKLCFRPNDAAAKGLYLSAGFEPDKRTAILSLGSV